jgi:predicted nuclease with TOPRIM domain
LVEDLTARGYQSPHLERLRERLPRGHDIRSIEAEMLQEMADSLARAGEKVDHALLQLELIGRAVDEGKSTVGKYNEQREVALKAIWELKVHREAIGLRQHHVIAQMYPVPPPRK